MQTLAAGVSFVDLEFQQVPHVIATVVLQGPSGVALIDPGPASTLPVLRRKLATAGLSMADVRDVLLTHIHLDHAGATGTLVKERPDLRVSVHREGAPHLIDPSKLLASAARLYGDAMDRLWGEVLPVPSESLILLDGGERIDVASRALEIAYTPGHARHHVSYFSRDTGIAFVGDTAGIRLAPLDYILPATPPPEVDLELWDQSLALVERWRPDTLFLTHFGPSGTVGAHLAELREHLDGMAKVVQTSLARDGSDEDREAWFRGEYRQQLVRRLGQSDTDAYETAGRLDLSWRGLARFWRKKVSRPAV
jgi:glyoxylase-like metal-dependent hydrolase (beta-lactamase superfamily II)